MKRDFVKINDNRIRVSEIVNYGPETKSQIDIYLSTGVIIHVRFDNNATRDSVLRQLDGVCEVHQVF